MKESKFIELLNLYVDQQIEPEEAAQLEAEILRNPERRRVYQQYCRMQRACALLVEQARPDVAVGEKLAATVAVADEKVMEFPVQRPNLARFIYVGGLVAACFAVAFVTMRSINRAPTSNGKVGGEQIVQITPAPVAKDAATNHINYQPVLVTHSWRLNNTTPGSALTATTGEQLSQDWMNQVKFTPINVSNEGLALGAQVAAKNSRPSSQQQVFENGLPQQGNTEQSAYRFQR